MQAATGLIQFPFRNDLPRRIASIPSSPPPPPFQTIIDHIQEEFAHASPQLHLFLDRQEEDRQVEQNCLDIFSSLEPWCVGFVVIIVFLMMFFVFKL